jgi:hypothetical protein
VLDLLIDQTESQISFNRMTSLLQKRVFITRACGTRFTTVDLGIVNAALKTPPNEAFQENYKQLSSLTQSRKTFAHNFDTPHSDTRHSIVNNFVSISLMFRLI